MNGNSHSGALSVLNDLTYSSKKLSPTPYVFHKIFILRIPPYNYLISVLLMYIIVLLFTFTFILLIRLLCHVDRILLKDFTCIVCVNKVSSADEK